MSAEGTLLTVTLRDPRGLVDVVAGDVRYSGEITDPPGSITVGQKLAMALEPDGSSPFDGIVEVMGKVHHIDTDSGALPNTPLFGGLVLHFEVARMTRSTSLFSADQPPTVEYDFDLEALGSRLESKVFKRRPVLASLELMGIEDEGDGPHAGLADTQMAPRPDMSADASLRSAEDEDEDGDRELTGVIGTLKMINLAEVVQGLELGRKTARVEVRPEEGPAGRVYVQLGAVVHTVRGEEEGETAFYGLVACRSGTYRVSFGREAPKQTINKPTAFLLLEAMRRLDEAGREEATVDETVEGTTREGGPRRLKPSHQATTTSNGREAVTAKGRKRPERVQDDDEEEATSPPGAPELSADEGEPVGPRIPTAVRENVVEALDQIFDIASADAEAVIDVDDELVVEESQLDGDVTMDAASVATHPGEPVRKAKAPSAADEHAVTLKAPRGAPTPLGADPTDPPAPADKTSAPPTFEPPPFEAQVRADRSPPFVPLDDEIAPVTDVDRELDLLGRDLDSDEPTGEAPAFTRRRAQRAAFDKKAPAREPTEVGGRQGQVFSGFFQEAREDTSSTASAEDDAEDDPAGATVSDLATLSLPSGAVPTGEATPPAARGG